MKFEVLWRPVETGDSEKLEFCRGGGKPALGFGSLFLVVGLLIFWQMIRIAPTFSEPVEYFLKQKEYGSAVSLCALESLSGALCFEFFALGIWMIFGRTQVQFDNVAKTITKEYLLRSFCLYGSIYVIGNSSYFYLRRNFRSFMPLHFLFLVDETDKRRRILIFPRKLVTDGWDMAEKMANLFGIPLREKELIVSK
jgi:hypothetical protein